MKLFLRIEWPCRSINMSRFPYFLALEMSFLRWKISGKIYLLPEVNFLLKSSPTIPVR